MSYKITEEGNIYTVFLNGEIDMDVTEDGVTTQKILLTTCWDKKCEEDELTTTVQIFE